MTSLPGSACARGAGGLCLLAPLVCTLFSCCPAAGCCTCTTMSINWQRSARLHTPCLKCRPEPALHGGLVPEQARQGGKPLDRHMYLHVSWFDRRQQHYALPWRRTDMARRCGLLLALLCTAIVCAAAPHAGPSRGNLLSDSLQDGRRHLAADTRCPPASRDMLAARAQNNTLMFAMVRLADSCPGAATAGLTKLCMVVQDGGGSSVLPPPLRLHSSSTAPSIPACWQPTLGIILAITLRPP